jgi:hypothetical protein
MSYAARFSVEWSTGCIVDYLLNEGDHGVEIALAMESKEIYGLISTTGICTANLYELRRFERNA